MRRRLLFRLRRPIPFAYSVCVLCSIPVRVLRLRSMIHPVRVFRLRSVLHSGSRVPFAFYDPSPSRARCSGTLFRLRGVLRSRYDGCDEI